MGMSSYVVGIVPADEKFNEMEDLYNACIKNNVSVPQEVWDFFEDEAPDPAGVIVGLPNEAVSEYNSDMQEGFEIDISNLDPKIKIIRFVNSY